MKAMDLFGKAVYDLYKGEQKTPFYLIDNNGDEYEQDLNWYFRKQGEFDSIEEVLLENIDGEKILDVGCATGYYFPIIQSKVKNIKGIDISEDLIKICKQNGYNNTMKLDIMSDNLNEQFDTIILMGNNLSIGGDIEGTNKLLLILKSLLAKNGKILSIFKKEEQDYFIGEFRSKYNGITSEPFKWIRININYLGKLLNKYGMDYKILGENDYGHCLEIKK